MKVTGYQLLDRIEELKEQIQTAESQFKTSLYRFAEEAGKKPEPRDLMAAFEAGERKIAILQEAQADYNLRVTVTVQDEPMTLHRAVKLIGSVNRIKNQWKTAAQESQNHYAYSPAMQRGKDNVYAERVVPIEECLRLSEQASRYASALKRAIRAGNATEIAQSTI
jgi:hypothetical protein